MNIRIVRPTISAAVLGCVLLCLCAASAWAGSPGDIDPTWNTSGQVDTPFGSTIAHSYASALDPNTDDLVAVGTTISGTTELGIVRYGTNGQIDTTFGGGASSFPIIGTDDEARAVAVEPDSSVVVVGTVTNAGVTQQAVVKFTPLGALDTTFGAGSGYVLRSGGGTNAAGGAVALQSDGKIIAAGGDDYADLFVTRTNADGTPDSGFGTAGAAELPVGYGGFRVSSATVEPNGAVLVFGTVAAADSSLEAITARLLPNGAPDPSFGTGGIVETELQNTDVNATYGVVQANGEITEALYIYSYTDGHSETVIGRLTASGAVDTTFEDQGFLTTRATAGDDAPAGIELGAFGKLDVFGTTGDPIPQAFTFQLLSNGRIDPNFGTAGYATAPIGSGASEITSGHQQADGNLIAFGAYHPSGSTSDFGGVRFVGTPSTDVVGPSAPLVTTDGDTANWEHDQLVHATFTGPPTDDNSGVAGYSWSWDQDPNGVPADALDGDWTTTGFASPQLPEGSNYLHVVTRDYAGNPSAVVTLGPFRVDQTAPAFTMNALYGDTTVTFTVHASDTGAGLAPLPYSYDGGVTWTSSSTYVLGGLTYGQTARLPIEVRDLTGNVSADTGYGLLLDSTPPTITPTGGLLTFASTKSPHGAGFTVADVGSGLTSVLATFRGRPVAMVDGLIPYSELPEGHGTLVIVARDAAGNVTKLTHQLTVDRTGPTISPLARYVMGPSVRLRAVDALSGVASANLRVALPKLGANSVLVKAQDRVGNLTSERVTVYRRISLATPSLNRGLRVYVPMGSFSVTGQVINDVFHFIGQYPPWYVQVSKPSPALVGEVQWRLQRLGFLGVRTTLSDRLDLPTIRAIERYQRARHIPDIGTVGPRTRKALDADLLLRIR